MGQSTIDSPVRASAKGNSIFLWKMQITWASSVPSLVKASSDVDVNIGVAASATDGGSGQVVNIKFPKGQKVRVLGANLTPATPGTVGNQRQVAVDTISASAGTAKVRMIAANGGAYSAPADGSLLDLVLLIE